MKTHHRSHGCLHCTADKEATWEHLGNIDIYLVLDYKNTLKVRLDASGALHHIISEDFNITNIISYEQR